MSAKKKKSSYKSISSLDISKGKYSKELEELKQNEVVYKSKIRALEVEVETLRYRLDSLRKAKNTTIVRREREEIRIATPIFSGHDSPHSLPMKPHPPPLPQGYQEKIEKQIKDLTSQVETLSSELTLERSQHRESLRLLADTHQKEMEALREAQAKMAEVKVKKSEHDISVQVSTKCDDCERIQCELTKMQTDYNSLTEHMEAVLATNEALRKSSLLLQERSAALLEELSVKEAEWSLREEKLQAAIREQWGQRYHEWIAKAEKKMAELQEVNTYLQQTIKKM